MYSTAPDMVGMVFGIVLRGAANAEPMPNPLRDTRLNAFKTNGLSHSPSVRAERMGIGLCHHL
jgi:hypothetical protein